VFKIVDLNDQWEEAVSAKLLLTINAVIAVLFGLAFVFMPTASLAVYGTPPDPHTALAAQFFGAALIGLGVVSWFARDFGDWDAVRGADRQRNRRHFWRRRQSAWHVSGASQRHGLERHRDLRLAAGRGSLLHLGRA
jgi:hypothetical protein